MYTPHTQTIICSTRLTILGRPLDKDSCRGINLAPNRSATRLLLRFNYNERRNAHPAHTLVHFVVALFLYRSARCYRQPSFSRFGRAVPWPFGGDCPPCCNLRRKRPPALVRRAALQPTSRAFCYNRLFAVRSCCPFTNADRFGGDCPHCCTLCRNRPPRVRSPGCPRQPCLRAGPSPSFVALSHVNAACGRLLLHEHLELRSTCAPDVHHTGAGLCLHHDSQHHLQHYLRLHLHPRHHNHDHRHHHLTCIAVADSSVSGDCKTVI
jgi:hypothetical protein